MSSLEKQTQNEPSDDVNFFDVIDLLAYAWKRRFWICVGIASGFIATHIIGKTLKPTQYVAQLPFKTIAPSNLQNIEVLPFLNQSLSKSEDIKQIKQSYSLTAGPTLRSSSGILYAEIASRIADSTANRYLEIGNALSEALDKVTNTLLVPNGSNKKSPPTSSAEENYSRLIRNKNLEEAPFLNEIFTIESHVFKKSRPYIEPLNSELLSVSRIMQLLAISDSKLSDAEIEKIIGTYSESVARLQTIRAKYERPLKELDSGLSSISDLIISSILIPVGKPIRLEFDKNLFLETFSSKRHERVESHQIVYNFIGAILGLFASLIASHVFSFYKKNWGRIKLIFSK